MTVYDLCTRLGEILPKKTLRDFRMAGILRTKQIYNSDVKIDTGKVHARLKSNIEKVKRESAKTISDLQAGIDLIESLK